MLCRELLILLHNVHEIMIFFWDASVVCYVCMTYVKILLEHIHNIVIVCVI